MLISQIWRELSPKTDWNSFLRIVILPAKNNITKLVVHDIDLLFEGQKSETVISRKQ